MMHLTLCDSFCVMVLLALGAQSAEHVVTTTFGDAKWMWDGDSNDPVSYGTLVAAVGDTIVFNYNANHDVMKMSDSTYSNCGATGNTELANGSVAGGSGSLPNMYTYMVTSADQTAGTIYFACSNPMLAPPYSHCSNGQRLKVTVGVSEHVVTTTGGDAKWSPGSYGTLVAAEGDTIVFNYDPDHDVMKMVDNTCTPNGNTELANSSQQGGPTPMLPNMYTYTVTSADQTAGTIYFACSYPTGSYGHCSAGQKLTVTVGARGTTTRGSAATMGSTARRAQSMFGYAAIPLAALATTILAF